jgi:hypothetical protein
MTRVDFERLAESADDAPAATNTKAPLAAGFFPFIYLFSGYICIWMDRKE